MRRPVPERLRSAFLRDVFSAFVAKRRGWQRPHDLELEENTDSQPESLAVIQPIYGIHAYQALTIWEDQVAIFSIREATKRRLYAKLFRLEEFPVPGDPQLITATFWNVRDRLGYALRRDTAVITLPRDMCDDITTMWNTLSERALH